MGIGRGMSGVRELGVSMDGVIDMNRLANERTLSVRAGGGC